MELDIWLGGRRVAATEARDRGRKFRIRYAEEVVASLPAELPLLSCSLPLPGPSPPGPARSFLEGLLPEGRALEAAAASLRGVRVVAGMAESPQDVLGILAEFGRECAGAVALVPAGEPFETHEPTYRPLDEEDVAARLAALPTRPLGADPATGVRLSLAGVQPKLLLARFDNHWFEPVDGAATTHILKPTGPWPDSARNEALILALGRTAGLTPVASWVETFGNAPVLITERFDRQVVEGLVQRSHQEDMCQALGLRPGDKYHVGRPSERMARLLRRLADQPVEAVEALFQQVAFRVIVGDEDGHGKNYSVRLDDGHVAMAPLYDSLCTLVYPQLSGRMGTPIGRQVRLPGVDHAALLEEAAAMGIPVNRAEELLDGLTGALRRGVEDLDDSLTNGWQSHPVTELVLRRIRRLH